MSNKNGNVSRAIIKEIDGRLVLDDPEALAIINVVNKHNCEISFDLNSERINHFKERMIARDVTPQEFVIAFISVDDQHGRLIADVLMPNYNWQEIRDRGEKPFARGLVDRSFINEGLELFDEQAAKKLKELTEGVAVVVVDFGVAEIFQV